MEAEQQFAAKQQSTLPMTTSLSGLRRSKDTSTRQHAFEHFYEKYYGPIIKLFMRKGYGQDVAHDLATDLLLKLKARLEKFEYDPQKSFRAYLRTCARNAVNDFVKKNRRTKNASDEALAAIVAPPEMEEWLRNFFNRELLEDAKKELLHRNRNTNTARDLSIYWEVKVQERAVQDVAKEFGLKSWNIYKICHRTHEKLEQITRELDGEHESLDESSEP